MKKVIGKNFELIPVENNECGKTALSKHKRWETVDGDLEIGGVYYDRSKKGILCQVVEDVIKGRKILKKKMFIADAIENGRSLEAYENKLVDEVKMEGESSGYYDNQQYVRKILANSIFGCASNEHFHLYNYYNGVSITLGGQALLRFLQKCLNEYMKLKFHKMVPKIFPEYKGDCLPLQKDVVCQMDTDSLFLCFEEVVENLNISFENDQEIFDWMDRIHKVFVDPFIELCLNNFAQKYNLEQIINFKREKIITEKIIIAKKKYVDRVLADEDKLYIQNPKIKKTGIETVRSDTPNFCKEKLDDLLKYMFEVKLKDQKKVLSKIREVNKEFKNANISDIAIPKGVSDYTKYASPTEHYVQNGLIYPNGCPIHVRASMNYNYLVQTLKLPLMPITNGTKVKFVHTSKINQLDQDVVAFINEWPEEFNNEFSIDYDRQFNRTFMSVIQRFFDVLKWGKIQLEENTLDELIQF